MELMKIKADIEDTLLEIAVDYRKKSEDLVFFIHGLGCCKESFEGVWSRPDFAGFSLAALDLAGFGASSCPDAFSYSMQAQAEICTQVLSAFDFTRLHIVAHSMGGAVGLLLPETLLEKTVSFANIEGNLIAEDCGLVSRKTVSVPFGEFEKVYFPYFMKQFRNEKRYHIHLEKTSANAFYKSSESLVEWSDSNELLKRFHSLDAKKTYFFGEKNADLKALEMLDRIESVPIQHSGHFVMNDNPDEFYARLLQHLN